MGQLISNLIAERRKVGFAGKGLAVMFKFVAVR